MRRYRQTYSDGTRQGASGYGPSCLPIHSRSAASIRVCQPRPPTLRCSITSRESRLGLVVGAAEFAALERQQPCTSARPPS